MECFVRLSYALHLMKRNLDVVINEWFDDVVTCRACATEGRQL